MKKILVPIDFSKHGYYALEVGANLARKINAELHIVHVLAMPHGAISDGDTPASIYLLKMTKKKMQEALKKPYLEGLEVKEEIIFDAAIDEITTKAEDMDIDLIVMGTHGTSGSKDFLIGSNTEKIVRTAKMPVIAVKERLEDFNPKDIVFASNFYGEVDSVFETVKEFATLFGAKIHLLKVITPNSFERTPYSEKLLVDFAKRFNLDNYTKNIFNDEHVEDGINDFSRIAGADMICMSTHGRTGLARILNGSIAEEITNTASLPVMSIRVKEMPKPEGVLFPEVK